jgi:hypothetical protein
LSGAFCGRTDRYSELSEGTALGTGYFEWYCTETFCDIRRWNISATETNILGNCGADSSASGYGRVAGCCDDGNEHSIDIKCGK